MMRAAVCREIGSLSDVTVADVPDLEPGPGQVRVRVRAASVNFPDVLIVRGLYQLKVTPPFTPGSEFAGEVDAVGDGVVNVAVGDRVSGAVLTGAFAERIVVPATAVHPTPVGLDDVQAAAFRVAYTTAYHSLVTIAAAQPGQTVVVLGAAGGVGLAAVHVAGRIGLRVIAVASSPERVRVCLEEGADAAVDYSREPLKERLKQLSDGGADVVIDPVGGDIAEPALRSLGWGGRYVTVGYASGTIPQIPLNLVLLKGIVVRGFELRTLPEHLPDAIAPAERALADLVGAGMRPLVRAAYPLDQVAAAFEHVADRRAIGKVVIDLSG